MKKSEQVSKLKAFPASDIAESSLRVFSPQVTVNQICHSDPHHATFKPKCCMDLDCFCRANQEFSLPACGVESKEQMQQRDPGGARRGENCHWPSAANRTHTREEDEFGLQPQSDWGDLETPLPLRSDDEWQYYDPFVPPPCYIYNYREEQLNLTPLNKQEPQRCHHSVPFQHRRPWEDTQKRCYNSSLDLGGVSVNEPQFLEPPVGSTSHVSAKNLSSAGASVSHPHEKRRSIVLPDVCRNVFITYSLDISSEIVPFIEFLRQRGFQPSMDKLDNPVRFTDITKRKDSYLTDPSTLIIIAISPKYKSDTEGTVVDSHGLHTKYIHTMMQNEYIQQGSLNFRFIPVLFCNASLIHVPSWLQNTRVYRWPWDTEDLLLRLLGEERYFPPPVPVELTLIISPVAASSAAPL